MQFSVSLSKTTGIAFTTYPAVTVAEFDKLMARSEKQWGEGRGPPPTLPQ